MSNSVVLNNGNAAHITTDTSKIFLWDNRYDSESYVNNSLYSPITLLAGTVMARIALSNVLVPVQGGATDGSNLPVGILAQDLVVAGGSTVQAAICIKGDVNQDRLVWYYPAVGLRTVSGPSGGQRTMFDWITQIGINLVSNTEMTAFDNS